MEFKEILGKENYNIEEIKTIWVLKTIKNLLSIYSLHL